MRPVADIAIMLHSLNFTLFCYQLNGYLDLYDCLALYLLEMTAKFSF